MTQGLENILVWQKAHGFVVMVYHTTKTFPESERFGLCSRVQRAAVSMAAD